MEESVSTNRPTKSNGTMISIQDSDSKKSTAGQDQLPCIGQGIFGESLSSSQTVAHLLAHITRICTMQISEIL